jgi:hypothetical protein
MGDIVTVASGIGVAAPKLCCGVRSLQGGFSAQTWHDVAVGPPNARRLLQLLQKMVKLDGDDMLGFQFLRLKIGTIMWAIYRGFGTIS